MTEATVTNRYPNSLAEEHVQLTVTDEETFISKLSNVKMVHMSWSEDMDSVAPGATAVPSYSVSGRTITFHAMGVTDKKLDVTVRGNL